MKQLKSLAQCLARCKKYLASSTEQSVPVVGQKIFGYFFPREFVSVPHLEVECFPETPLSTGTVAPVRNHKQKSLRHPDSPFNRRFCNKVRPEVEHVLLMVPTATTHRLANIHGSNASRAVWLASQETERDRGHSPHSHIHPSRAGRTTQIKWQPRKHGRWQAGCEGHESSSSPCWHFKGVDGWWVLKEWAGRLSH